MPAQYNYNTEEAYQQELKKVRDARRDETMKKVSMITVRAKGGIPELTEEEEGYCYFVKVDLRSKKAEKVSSEIRSSLLRSWHRDNKGNCIIVVSHRINLTKGETYYKVELTAFGATLQKDWVKDQLRALGYEITGYKTQRDLTVYGKGSRA